jgi:hypothetical protein
LERFQLAHRYMMRSLDPYSMIGLNGIVSNGMLNDELTLIITANTNDYIQNSIMRIRIKRALASIQRPNDPKLRKPEKMKEINTEQH